jgi:hypothetical protein
MSQALSFYEGHSFYEGVTWSFVREEIGQGLKKHYGVPAELPPKLLTLVMRLAAIEAKPQSRRLLGRLDAIEGSYLLRNTPPAEPRSEGGDWLVCT